jgi:hypothetical protein
MSARSLLKIALLTAGALGAAAATPILKGPPWISIEYPANPHDPSTRDAYLLVHAFHHGTAMNFPVEGRAEGVQGGRRTSQALTFTSTSRTGVFALRKSWPAEGTWVLVIRVNQGSEGAQALVEMDANGGLASVTVPTRRTSDGWTVPQPVTQEMVETALRARAAMAAR